MDLQSLLNLILGSSVAVIGWLARTLWDAVQALRKDLSSLREEIAEDRVHKDDFKELSQTIMRKLDKIEDKIDRKADK